MKEKIKQIFESKLYIYFWALIAIITLHFVTLTGKHAFKIVFLVALGKLFVLLIMRIIAFKGGRF